MIKFIQSYIWTPIVTVFWTKVYLGFEQDLHNKCGGITYKKPNLTYRICRLFDKEFREQCDKCIYDANNQDWTRKRSYTAWEWNWYKR